MAKQKAESASGAADKAAKARKRVVKVESVGEAHINATFNNIIISLTKKMVKLFHGVQQVKWVSEVLKRTHPMQLNLHQQIARKSLSTMV